MAKPICVALPYPQLSSKTFDNFSASVISSAYASAHSELNAILQYTYHSFNFYSQEDQTTNEIIQGIAVCEMKHLEILGHTLCDLGVDPVMTALPPYKFNYFNSFSVQYSTLPQKMLMDDISGEMVAINEYRKMLNKLLNEEVAAIISRIILDEELHVKVLKARLEEICSR